jgi:REP element-mobilizing transposase RayT
MWNLPPPPGFQGLHPDKPVTFYERNLPHWRQAGATYFVTFRLGDSLPQDKLRELEGFKREWERRHPPPRSGKELDELARELVDRIERWLDQGYGDCVLKQPNFASLVTEAMHHFDGNRYELGAYVVMPNHVHLIVRPMDVEDDALELILKSWKQFSARRINTATGGRGMLWQQESFDRIVRDAEHLYRALQYIGRNPDKAGLTKKQCPLWVRPEWVELGWKFEDQLS